MPLLQKTEENNCQIAIWEICESLKELALLSNNIDISKFKQEKRKKEVLSSKLLLNEIFPNTEISYNKYGAPEIQNNYFISISHSSNLIGIITSKKKVGIDLQKISEKALNLSSKFILKGAHLNITKEKATLIWCCKEAIFKWYQKGNINFITDIIISPFIIKEQGKILAEFKNQEYTLHYTKIDDHFLVYVCK